VIFGSRLLFFCARALADAKLLQDVKFVMKAGAVYKNAGK
jgi:hypothetical protein